MSLFQHFVCLAGGSGFKPSSSFWSLHVQSLSGSVPPPHDPKICKLIGDSKLPVRVNETVNGLFVCDGLAAYPGCTLPVAQCQLGSAPAPSDPAKEERFQIIDGCIYWKKNVLLFLFSFYGYVFGKSQHFCLVTALGQTFDSSSFYTI